MSGVGPPGAGAASEEAGAQRLEEDRALLEAFRRGEAAALARVYRAYAPGLARYLSRTFRVRTAGGGDGRARVGPLDLEAAHQEAFARAFRERARLAYDGVRPFGAYLQAVARSAAVDVLRSAGRVARDAVALEDAPAGEWLADPAAGPEERALQAEVRALVQDFLAGLDPQARAFADARFVQGLSQERAGALLGLSRQEARTREARLRAGLLAHLGARGWLDAAAPALTRTAASVLLAWLASP